MGRRCVVAQRTQRSGHVHLTARVLVGYADTTRYMIQVELGAGVAKAIILGNLFKGATRITNKASVGNVQVGYNADG